MLGFGSIGLEILEQIDESLSVVVLPAYETELVNSISIIIKHFRPSVQIIVSLTTLFIPISYC